MNQSSIPGGPWTIELLAAAFPWIEWRMPAEIHIAHDSTPRYACRVCIANRGLTYDQAVELPTDAESITRHLSTAHENAHNGANRL